MAKELVVQRVSTNGRAPAEEGVGKLSILMPIYNERRTVGTILRRVLETRFPVPLELVAVDDGSTDGSADILRRCAESDSRIKPVFHSQNTGKGGAIRTAIAHMTGGVAVIQDADLEYDPAEIPRLIAPILQGHADAVFGSRFAGGEVRRVLYYWHSLANRVLTRLTNIVCDVNLTDVETCYKAVRTSVLKQLRLKVKGFGMEPELAIRLAQWGARMFEVPISYRGRTYAEGKKITWRDGWRALAAILWSGLWDRRFTHHDGYYILTSVRNARRFNRWMFRTVERFVGQNVLEAGCGIGNFTELFIHRARVVSVDIDPLYTHFMQQRFGDLENFRVIQADLAHAEVNPALTEAAFDTILCMNVLEHIDDDAGVLIQFQRILQPGGRVVILVPQHPWLYTRVDRTLGHFRRYRLAELTEKVRRAGLEVEHVQGFNKLATFGWFVSGKILRHQHLTPQQMRLFNRLVPVARVLEYVPLLPAQSLIVVGRKPLAPATPTRSGAERILAAAPVGAQP